MADRCGFLLADSHLCSELKGHYASPHQWRAEDEEVWVAVENIARRKTLEPTYTAAQLSQAVEAAQGAILEAAKRALKVCEDNAGITDGSFRTWRAAQDVVDALQTEPMAAARDKLVEVLKVWYSVFCAIMDTPQEGQDWGRLRQLRARLAQEVPGLEAAARKETP